MRTFLPAPRSIIKNRFIQTSFAAEKKVCAMMGFHWLCKQLCNEIFQGIFWKSLISLPGRANRPIRDLLFWLITSRNPCLSISLSIENACPCSPPMEQSKPSTLPCPKSLSSPKPKQGGMYVLCSTLSSL